MQINIEKLDARAFLDGQEQQWVALRPKCRSFTPRCYLSAQAINETEILMMGGLDDGDYKSDTHLLDSTNDSVSKLCGHDPDFLLGCFSN